MHTEHIDLRIAIYHSAILEKSPWKATEIAEFHSSRLNGRDWCPKAEIGNIQRAESRNRNASCCKLSSFLAIIVDWNSQGHPFIL